MATIQTVEALTGHEVTFSGGGRGQVAQVQLPDGSFAATKGTSKQAAVDALHKAVKAELARASTPAKADRATVDDVLAVLSPVFGEISIVDETDDRPPAPTFKGLDLVELTPCVGECMFARPESICDCRCEGSNHAIGNSKVVAALSIAREAENKAAFKAALESAQPTQYGEKPCLCGCGQTTLRRFVPGHDARYHARIKREQRAAEAGITLDELAVQDRADRLARERAKRAARKEAA